MCYSTAANSGAQLIQALKEGILILLFPSLLIGTLFVVIAYRKRNQYAKY
jgi:cellobiose-specific phosphotransferase system component IIC